MITPNNVRNGNPPKVPEPARYTPSGKHIKELERSDSQHLELNDESDDDLKSKPKMKLTEYVSKTLVYHSYLRGDFGCLLNIVKFECMEHS